MELLSPKFEESRAFFVDVFGMTESARKALGLFARLGRLRALQPQLTASTTSGMAIWRFAPAARRRLSAVPAALQGSGFHVGWSDGDLATVRHSCVRDPDGHTIELYYETEWYQPDADKRPALKNQAQRFPARGVNVRRLDPSLPGRRHQANREFFERYLAPTTSRSCSTMARERHVDDIDQQEL